MSSIARFFKAYLNWDFWFEIIHDIWHPWCKQAFNKMAEAFGDEGTVISVEQVWSMVVSYITYLSVHKGGFDPETLIQVHVCYI
jgi:hypothetical protein